MEKSALNLFPNEYDLEHFLTVKPKKWNFSMRVAPRYVYHFVEHDYESFTADLIATHVKKLPIFIDIGAHYGFYTLLVASVSPNTRVLAFEPSPVNVTALRENVSLNGFANIEVEELALSNSNESKIFHVAEASDSGGFTNHPLAKTAWEIPVTARRLDSLQIDGLLDQPVLIKLDAEGHELEILEGMRSILETNRRLELVIEFNPKCLRSAGHRPVEVLEFISRLGYAIFFLDDKKRIPYKVLPQQFDEWVQKVGNGYFNVFCCRQETSLSVLWFSHAATLTGGAEKSLIHIVENLQRNHHVLNTVIVPGDGHMRDWVQEHAIGTLPTPVYTWWAKNNQNETAASLAVILNLLDELRLINPDLIVTNTLTIPWGAISANFLHKPHIWFVRELFEFEMSATYNIPLEEIRGIILESSNQVVTLTHAIKERNFGRNANVLVLPRPVKIPEITSTVEENTSFKNPAATKLLFAGGIREEKGIQDAVLAVKNLLKQGLSNIELVIIGPDDEPTTQQEIQRIVHQNNLENHIQFLGWQKNPFDYIRQADIILVCSKYNSFLRVTLEAAYFRKPVISSDNPGGRETIIENETGLFYQSGNHEELASKIAVLIQDPTLAKELGEHAFYYAHKNFDPDAYEARIFKLFQSMKQASKPNSPRLSTYIQHLMQKLVEQKDAYIEEIQHSLTWSLALKIRKLRMLLLPDESKLYKASLPLLRLIRSR
jgi:FkbM family methyltransferase